LSGTFLFAKTLDLFGLKDHIMHIHTLTVYTINSCMLHWMSKIYASCDIILSFSAGFPASRTHFLPTFFNLK